MRLGLKVVVATGVLAGSLIVSASPVAACHGPRGDSVGCDAPAPDTAPSPGAPGDRILNLGGSGNRVSDGVTISTGSAVYTYHPPPRCRYQTVETTSERYAYVLDNEGVIVVDPDGEPVVDEARGPVTEAEIDAEDLITVERSGFDIQEHDDGRYVYVPIEIDWDNLTEDYGLIVNDIARRFGERHQDVEPSIAARYSPIDRQMRRLWIRCEEPGSGQLDGTFYPDFIEVSILDPMWEVESVLARLERELVFPEPTIVDDLVLDRWEGLVVRSPVWFSIPTDDWQLRSTRVVEHRTNTFAMFGYPTLLQFDVDFTPHPDEPPVDGLDARTAWDGTIDCLSSATFDTDLAAGGGTMPARPSVDELGEFSVEVGDVGPCTWVPPMRGSVTVTGRVEYRIISLLNGQTYNRQDRFHDFSSTWQVGELRAVNVNDPNG